ncbi:MAG: hypothetical protein U1A78_06120 [Polyangia bacterium]
MQLRLVLAGALFTSALLVGPSLSRADLIPSVPPECVGKPEGTPCTLGNGTAGQCAVRKDPRRPTVAYTICDRDEHECDRLAVGAVCRGYLGKPAHCREFKNAEKTWRTCQLDEHQAAADAAGQAPAAPAPAATPAPAPAATPAPATETRGRFGCSTLPGAATGPTGLTGALALGALGLLLAGRVRRRAPQRA